MQQPQEQLKNLTSARADMMKYYVDWVKLISLGKVIVTGNSKNLDSLTRIRNLENFLVDQNYSVFTPYDLYPTVEDLKFGERSHYTTTLQRACSQCDFMFLVLGEELSAESMIHLGMALSRNIPVITTYNMLEKPYDTLVTLHLNNDTEINKFFDLLQIKSNVSNFKTKFTGMQGYFHNRSE